MCVTHGSCHFFPFLQCHSFFHNNKHIFNMLTSLAELTDSQKGDMMASLSIFLAASGTAEEGEDLITPAKLQAIAKASGNSLSESLATLFASVASNAPGGVLEAYMPSPGGGGGYVLLLQWCCLFCFPGSIVSLTILFRLKPTAAVVVAAAVPRRPKQSRKKKSKKRKLLRVAETSLVAMLAEVETIKALFTRSCMLLSVCTLQSSSFKETKMVPYHRDVFILFPVSRSGSSREFNSLCDVRGFVPIAKSPWAHSNFEV